MACQQRPKCEVYPSGSLDLSVDRFRLWFNMEVFQNPDDQVPIYLNCVVCSFLKSESGSKTLNEILNEPTGQHALRQIGCQKDAYTCIFRTTKEVIPTALTINDLLLTNGIHDVRGPNGEMLFGDYDKNDLSILIR